MAAEEVLAGGHNNPGTIIRRGDVVHRPRLAGSDIVEALLLHLERVGFDGAPRFLGYDNSGRQVLSYVEGETYPDHQPPWIDDDAENARVLGRVAAFLCELHAATAGYEPPDGAQPFRPLPLTGTTSNHADAQYGNVVFRDRTPVAIVDWECAAPGAASTTR